MFILNSLLIQISFAARQCHAPLILRDTIPETLNPLSANPTKWSNTLKQFVGNLSTNCLNVFDHFVKLVLKGLTLVNGNDRIQRRENYYQDTTISQLILTIHLN